MDENTIKTVKHLSDRYVSFRLSAFAQRSFPPELLHKQLESLEQHSDQLLRLETVGRSFEGHPIRSVNAGQGAVKVLLWSQMHGDESTATMAICDILNFFCLTKHEAWTAEVLSSLRLSFLPMLNPDGAARFQRRTAQGIDMNRDALALRTPEARLLKQLQQEMQPAFAFNLHDQELSTVGSKRELTALALLAPAFDPERSDNDVRLRAKHLAALLTDVASQFIPGHITKYDDSFESRAFGDSMQAWGTSTILVESGHIPNDPDKDFIRKLNFIGILAGLDAIATGEYQRTDLNVYDELPLNGKRAHDLIVRDVRIDHGRGQTTSADLGISSQVDTHSEPPPKLVDLGDLSTFVGLNEIDGRGKLIPASAVVLGSAFEWERHLG